MTNRLLSIPEAAERLGLAKRTVQRWVSIRRLTYVKVGSAVRIPEPEIARVIDEGTVTRLDPADWLPVKVSPPHKGQTPARSERFRSTSTHVGLCHTTTVNEEVRQEAANDRKSFDSEK